MRRYVTAFNWGPCVQQVQREQAKECLDSAVRASKDHALPFGFHLVIAEARNIWGTVLLLIVEPGYDSVPQTTQVDPSSLIRQWLWDKVDNKWKWLDSDVLWAVDQPLNWYFKELRVLEAVHVPGTHMNSKDAKGRRDAPQVAISYYWDKNLHYF